MSANKLSISSRPPPRLALGAGAREGVLKSDKRASISSKPEFLGAGGLGAGAKSLSKSSKSLCAFLTF